ncbi:MAG TPA: amidohydrolase family protein [Dehalococcoidia bacterium]|nr:amidohydrolase family protein [Dehalococcoidia bacterium]
MAYDLIVRGGTIVDGSGMPRFRGDIAVQEGRIAVVGKVSGSARRVLDAGGLVVAPGVIDNHCHYDAQVTWDPLCTFSCYHGATTVVIGNCSLALAPAHEYDRGPLASLLSRVEAIPLEALDAGVAWAWETIPQYYDALDRRLGVNVASFIGHSAVRRYVMGDASYEREATDDEIGEMRGVVREGMAAGAIGVSFERNIRHFDHEGRIAPTYMASDLERFSVAGVLDELGRGTIQVGGDPQLGVRLAQAGGRPVLYGSISQNAADPDAWRRTLEDAAELGRQGLRTFRLLNPRQHVLPYTLKNAQHFDAHPTWKTVMMLPLGERKRAFRDPATRAKLHYEVVETPYAGSGEFVRRWDTQVVCRPALTKNSALAGKSVAAIAADQNRDVLDVFLDLALEEELETVFERRETNSDPTAVAEMLHNPHVLVGQSDGGAHVVFRSDYSYPTYLLGHWVREEGILSLEEAVRKLTFDSACVFGLGDRGLLRPGWAADMMVFDPETIASEDVEDTPDLPGGASRRKQLAKGIQWTLVNGEVLVEQGSHTGAYPGKVVGHGRR